MAELTLTGPRPVRPVNEVIRSYAELSAVVRQLGLLGRTRGFYIAVFSGLCVALVVLGGTFALLGDSWFQLLVAAALGVVLTQLSFLAHEASHRQVLTSGPANDKVGRILATGFVGISYAWWMNKHSRHHANPNRLGKDPDIDMDTISFHQDDAAKRTGLSAAFVRKQGYLFFPLLTLEGINLHVTSLRWLFSHRDVAGRRTELWTVFLRLGIYVGLIGWLLPPGKALAFLGVQLVVFGVYMGGSFAPNHKGMPIIPADVKLDFFSKQVLTSRNVSGGWLASWAFGGLNYQIEHHLFPSMPRPHLARAREIVRDHCEKSGVVYTETTIWKSYGIVIRYLNDVGLAARDPFDCPALNDLRRR